MFSLPDLPYDPNAFGGFSSAETFQFHHGKHHAGYVKKLNAALEGADYDASSLEAVIATSRTNNDAAVFNSAAQHFNHSFFWNCLQVDAATPEGALAEGIDRTFGSFDGFKEQFSEVAAKHFGSGWAWLAQAEDGTLKIAGYHDADTPAGTGKKPLLTLDVWEHAYYIDHRNDRAAYIKAFWDHVNWSFVAKQLKG